MRKIKVILADDNKNTRSSIRKLLELDDDIDIVAEAANGREVLEKVEIMEPDIVIMDVRMPELDGFEAAQNISLHYPNVSVIMISVNDEPQNFKRAMMAGAKEYLVKPLSPEELNSTVKQVAELNRKRVAGWKPQPEDSRSYTSGKPNRLVTVFSPKGGVGKSVVCANLAAAMAQRYEKQIGLIDLDIQFGDIGILMDLNPRKTISELMQEGDSFNRELLEDYLYERNGVNILAAPNKPELAELVTPHGVEEILKLCRDIYTYTFVDTPSFMNDITLSALEMSDLILLLISLDLSTIKNVKKGINILHSLQLLSKTRLVLNHSSGVSGIEARDVEKVLDMKVQAEIPNDGKVVITSVNQGIPFVKMNPKAAVSKGIMNILKLLEV
ncbi:MAG: response regulator [Syntrophomonadaceae bacterium]|nr:response regulator [Syntrophomonadaceae bacterium]